MNYFLIGAGIAFVGIALGTYARVAKLEKKLKEKGILEADWDRT